MRSKLRQPYPQHGLEWRIVIAIVVALAMGVAASIWQSDWEHLARSGSTIVVVGIYVTWKDITGKIDFAKRFLLVTIEKEKSELESVGGGLLTKARNQEFEVKLDEMGEELAGLLETTRGRIRALEVGTIVLGTLVWGFGDLVGKMVA